VKLVLSLLGLGAAAWLIVVSAPAVGAPASAAQQPKQAAERDEAETAVRPKPVSSRSLAHLFERMSKQPPLTELDVALYERHLAAILDLNENPAGLDRLLELTGWTEDRLTYTVAKIGLGLLAELDPENQHLINAPEFALPAGEEIALIKERQGALSRAFQRLAANRPKP
jgi:hypothetical protein